MLKYKEFDNLQVLDALADILEPVSIILTNGKIKEAIQKEKNKLLIAKVILKECPKEILSVLARLDDTPIDDYKCSIVSVPIAILEILNDEVLVDFFKSQGLSLDNNAFGSAMENTEETETT